MIGKDVLKAVFDGKLKLSDEVRREFAEDAYDLLVRGDAIMGIWTIGNDERPIVMSLRRNGESNQVEVRVMLPVNRDPETDEWSMGFGRIYSKEEFVELAVSDIVFARGVAGFIGRVNE